MKTFTDIYLNEIIAYENGKLYFVLPTDFKKKHYRKEMSAGVIQCLQYFVDYNDKKRATIQLNRDENKEALLKLNFPNFEDEQDPIKQEQLYKECYIQVHDFIYNVIVPKLEVKDFYRDSSKRGRHNRRACHAYEFIFKRFRERVPKYKNCGIPGLYLKFEFLYDVIKNDNDEYEFITPGKNYHGDMVLRLSHVTLNNISVHR